MSDDSKMNSNKEGLSRRQFLTYALGGTGAFMATSILAPMIPFAVDPLTKTVAGSFVPVGKATDFGPDLPKQVSFKVKKKDGWVESEADMNAWIIQLKNGKYLAMSPICTHLGCLVNGSVDASGKSVPPSGEWFFHCPCHNSLFDKYGVNSPTSPAQRPLDVYDVKVDEKGEISLGPITQRKV